MIKFNGLWWGGVGLGGGGGIWGKVAVDFAVWI